MEVNFNKKDLERLETDMRFTAGYSQEVVREYRRRVQQIRAFLNERDFYCLKALQIEKFEGNRLGLYSVKLNLQWRLLFQLLPNNTCCLVELIEVCAAK